MSKIGRHKKQSGKHRSVSSKSSVEYEAQFQQPILGKRKRSPTTSGSDSFNGLSLFDSERHSYTLDSTDTSVSSTDEVLPLNELRNFSNFDDVRQHTQHRQRNGCHTSTSSGIVPSKLINQTPVSAAPTRFLESGQLRSLQQYSLSNASSSGKPRSVLDMTNFSDQQVQIEDFITFPEHIEFDCGKNMFKAWSTDICNDLSDDPRFLSDTSAWNENVDWSSPSSPVDIYIRRSTKPPKFRLPSSSEASNKSDLAVDRSSNNYTATTSSYFYSWSQMAHSWQNFA